MAMEVNREDRYRYGSYIDYYKNFRKELDPRMVIFDQTDFFKEIQEPVLFLDIGCNMGTLTKEIYRILSSQNYQPNMLGLDISQGLVDKANEDNKCDQLKFVCQDVMKLVTDPEEVSPVDQFLTDKRKSTFDIISCFSTTMYIHLIYGDGGLKKFLAYICQLGNHIILEPQPFKNYRIHRERMKKENKHKGPHDPYPFFPEKEGKIKWRHDLESEICSYIQTLGFDMIFQSKSEDWDRDIFIFKKQN